MSRTTNQTLAATALALAVSASGAVAQQDPYATTAAERQACMADGMRLCSAAYPDAQAILGCMVANRESLSPACQVTLDAGLRSRGMQ